VMASSSRVLTVALTATLALPALALAQDRGNPYGEWRYQSADAWGTRFSPVNQVDASNFGDLEVAWTWRSDNFGPDLELQMKATPQYIDGVLYTVAGHRRTVVAIDPETGETLWTYREPNTTRWERSMRQNYGKGVAYGEIDGRGVIFYTSPAFFLHALDAQTGRHIENFGTRVPLPGFPETGVVDLIPDLVADWGPWQQWDQPYDPDYGLPRELGYITSSSPPIVVNGVVVVGNSAEQGYNQTRVENVPGDILAYDARSGAFKWKFHVIPRPGEFGHDTWENDAWQWTGDVSSWAPMSADEDLGIVYIPTNPPTIDYFGGFRPGEGLFGTSVIALDVQTGQRRWHFQTVHNDQWNYDLPNVPIITNLTVDGRQIPAVVQTSKTGIIYAFNRESGEPIWPIVETPVPQTEVPGNWTSPTQPMPTRPEPSEPLGLAESDVIDFTPQLRAEALEMLGRYRVGGPFVPRLHEGHSAGVEANIRCYGGLNITSPATLDPTTGILYVPSSKGCSGGTVMSGAEADEPDNPMTTGTTISQWVAGPGGALPRVQGLPAWKPPYNRVSAYDMNTGERIWWIPIGEVPDNIRNHPVVQGMDISRWGGGGNSIQMVAGDLLYTTEGSNGAPVLNAWDKRTGEHVGEIEMPGAGQYGMMTYSHGGTQTIVVQVGDPARLVALRLPG
ncbi:MAG TPA: PQQ-binding-like beta-propeller repeat protein, partial [Longimicrobiales bacterium]|nr:PQQ-binding-like beta-propeller repeat protein [Longimicrobiales bacterium]